MNHFFLMGCWNDDHCEGLDYRTAVIEDIVKHKKNYQFGILAGDNVYQHDKIYYQKTLDYGFQQISKTELPLFVILGNHDVHKESILKSHLILNEANKIVLPYNCYVQETKNKDLRLIMIDTNLLTIKQNKDDVYKNLLRKYPNFFKVQTAEALLKNLEYELNKPFHGWTVIVGHEPILSYKLKNGQLKHSSLQYYDRLIQLMASCPKTIYMCADVHSFQVINIPYQSKFLPMVVAGTGGADPDINPNLSTTMAYNDYTFQLTAESPSYGYVSVEYDQTNFKVYFHPLEGCSEGQSMIELAYKKNCLELIQKTKTTKTCKAKPAPSPLCNDTEFPME